MCVSARVRERKELCAAAGRSALLCCLLSLLCPSSSSRQIAPSFVYLASNIDSSYVTGQVLHPNGGMAVHS